MKIIAIEGLDKSGKHTQSELLKKYLISKGYKVEKSEFHRYDTPTGQLIQQWLYGKYDADQKTIELIMSADKQSQQFWFDKLERSGVDFLILDRYTTSQQVYSEANGIDPKWTKELQKFMRKPDVEIFIDISPEISMMRKGKHGDNDRYESNLKLLKDVRDIFLSKYIYKIDGDNPMLKIHSDIIKLVEAKCLK